MTAIANPATAIEVPFAECEAMRRIRAAACRLTSSQMPISLSGEAGTGRRTFALGLAARRAERFPGRIIHVFGGDGLTAEIRTVVDHAPSTPTHLVLVGLEQLPAADQAWLGERLDRGAVVLTATLGKGAEGVVARPLQLRLAATVFELPPLNDRAGDVSAWFGLLFESAQDAAGGYRKRLDPRAMFSISAHNWPGNLTEMRTRIQRALVLSDSDVIGAADLDLPTDAATSGGLLSLEAAVDAFKRRYVYEALVRFGGNRSQTARALGIDARTVFRFLEHEREAKPGSE